MWCRRELELYDYSPDSLLNLCINYVAQHKNVILKGETRGRRCKLKDDIVLPPVICEKLLEAFQKYERLTDDTVYMFHDKSKTRLENIKLWNAKITDNALEWLMAHKPLTLDLSHCEYLTAFSVEIICVNSENLVSLRIGPSTPIFFKDSNIYKQKGFIINGPKIRKLVIHKKEIPPRLLLKSLSHITHLDLSDCTVSYAVWPPNDLKHLVSLVLHNFQLLVEVIDWICTLTNLQHLDLSQVNDSFGKSFNHPNQVLAKIVTSLPKLKSLDISGTNLAGTGAAVVVPPSKTSPALHCDIPGLVSRVERPLKFLGLYCTSHGACKRHDIPAEVITGDATEEQILNSAVAYMNRVNVLTRVLNDLYYLFRYDMNANVIRVLSVVLEAMREHVSEKHIQISGSATLFYIVKGHEMADLSIEIRCRIIRALLDGMEAHITDETMMRNGCLTLCQFKIPNDVMFEYERVVSILLNGVADLNQDGFVQRIAIYLLNSLACQVDGQQKQYLGNLGAISKMLKLIEDRLDRQMYDDVLEVAWSTMWNVTDETPQNCLIFLDNKGINYFFNCLNVFPNHDELLRNMMGLLGNVAEVPSLRPRLMEPVLVSLFYDLLNSPSDGIEVSYNAAGVLAHMASDGPEAWTVKEPSRDMVLKRMTSAVNNWSLQVERNINYRSFEPILGLLKVFHTPQCQHWAAWALANLTSVYPEKYCDLVESEGGIPLLQAIVCATPPATCAEKLALMVIWNCEKWALCKSKQNKASK